MLTTNFIQYLDALKLCPLWIDKQQQPRIFKPTQPKLDEVKINSVKNIKPISMVVKQHETKTHDTELVQLEIITRSHFFNFSRKTEKFLCGFLSPQLDQTVNPLENENYAKLLTDLFLQIDFSKGETINLTALLDKNIPEKKFSGIILFSEEFNDSTITTHLKTWEIPILILPHPLSLIRNPLLKAIYWHKLQALFKTQV